jgi:hypothetical protein
MEEQYSFTQDVIKSQVAFIVELIKLNDNSKAHKSKLLNARKVLVELLNLKADSSSCLFNCVCRLVTEAA